MTRMDGVKLFISTSVLDRRSICTGYYQLSESSIVREQESQESQGFCDMIWSLLGPLVLSILHYELPQPRCIIEHQSLHVCRLSSDQAHYGRAAPPLALSSGSADRSYVAEYNDEIWLKLFAAEALAAPRKTQVAGIRAPRSCI
nr:hypothetical protein CFP56_19597 [Quercus suber]